MKSRTKSTRENITIDSKSRKISDEISRNKKVNKKDDLETRKNLLRTLQLLQQQFKFTKLDKKSSNAQLSASVFDIVKTNITHTHSSVSKNNLQDYVSSMQLQRQPILPNNDINRSCASLINMSVIQGKRRSNSALDQYFKQKFGSPAKDQQTIEKKLRVLKALKKSQQIVSKVSHTKQLGKENHIMNDFEDKSILMGKLKHKKGK